MSNQMSCQQDRPSARQFAAPRSKESYMDTSAALTSALKVLAALGGVGAILAATGAVIWHFVRRFVDHRLETKLAGYKGELEREAERLRFELQREMLKAQLGTSRMYEIAPRLLVKLKRAYGAMSSVIGLSFSPPWREYSRSEMERALDDRKVFPSPLLSRVKDEILQDWDSTSPGLARSARDEVQRIYFRQKVAKAGFMAARAHNHAVLNAVFLPADLAAYATDTTVALNRAHVDVEMALVERAGGAREAHKNLQAIGARIEELERLIRAALAPAAAAASRPQPQERAADIKTDASGPSVPPRES